MKPPIGEEAIASNDPLSRYPWPPKTRRAPTKARNSRRRRPIANHADQPHLAGSYAEC